MRLSISDVLRYMDCPYAWRASHELQAWAPPSAAMRRGTAIHKLAEAKLKGLPLTGVPLANVEQSDMSFVTQALLYLQDWEPPFKVLAVEEPLAIGTVAGGSHTDSYTVDLVGRLDCRAEMNGKQWSVQWKTLSKGKPLASLLEKVRTSPHEITYHWLVRQAHGINLSGTILGVFQDLNKAQKAVSANMFGLYTLPRDWAFVETAMHRDIMPVLHEMGRYTGLERTRRDWRNCYGMFGNSPCPLFQHCHNGLPLNAGLLGLVPTEDRYADLPEVE